MRVRALTSIVLVAAALAATATAGDVGSETATLRLDGVPFKPELALTPAERQRGLMFRRKAPRDGMLFVFPRASSGGFWMKNTLVPLTIAFFDSRGKRVRKLSMTPCRQESCPVYDPGRQYRFAPELPAFDTKPATTLGPLVELRRLVSLAS
jgi:uncharacterized membrane protein (UPF0127 family)